jgi:hypothetical protein
MDRKFFYFGVAAFVCATTVTLFSCSDDDPAKPADDFFLV